MVSVENWNASKISTHDIFRAMQLSLHAAMAEPMTQVIGIKATYVISYYCSSILHSNRFPVCISGFVEVRNAMMLINYDFI